MPRRHPWVYIGLAAFFALLFVALFGERIAPHETIYYVLEHGSDPRPYDPGLVFPFGSDALGRDLFSLVLAGARATLAIVVLGGLARVAAGLLIAAAGTWSRWIRLGTDSLGELLSAVPATLVAVLIVKVFVRADTTPLLFVGALLVTGWAGPYRVLRAELDRLAQMQFTESASALGLGRIAILWRHHLPHLVPVLALNLSQQIVASLVLVAELGVLSVFVGSTRGVSLINSAKLVGGQVYGALISDPSEWGGLLANARTIESLWTTRWLFLVPGVAFAVTAVAMAAIGFALARHYARRNLLYDLRSKAASAVVVAVAAMVLVSASVPDRYAAAGVWGEAARAGLRDNNDVVATFSSTGARPVTATYALERDTTQVLRTGPATVSIGSQTVSEATTPATDIRSLAYAGTGAASIDAPLVFVGRGISPADIQPLRTSFFSAPDLGTVIAGFADDYQSVDVRGKVVLLVRFMGVSSTIRTTIGPDVESSIQNAIKRGAAAVLFVDPDLPRYVDVPSSFRTPVNPYKRLEANDRIIDPVGVPVVVLSPAAAERLVAPVGLSVMPLLAFIESGSEETRHSPSRDLSARARVDVSLEKATAHVRTFIAEVGDQGTEAGRIVVWAVRRPGAAHPTGDVLSALVAELAHRGLPFLFVDFDPSVDAGANALAVKDALAGRRIALMFVLDGLDGSSLRFTTPFGELVAAIDHYADQAGARHAITRSTESIETWSWPGIRPFVYTKAIFITGNGGSGDLRGDAAGLIGYIAGRYALGAEELPR